MDPRKTESDGNAQLWLERHHDELEDVAERSGLAPGLVRLAAVLFLHCVGEHAIYDELNAHVLSLDGQHAPLASAPRALDEIGVAVVGDVERPKGMISERDIITSLAQGDDPDSATAADAMTDYVISARGSDPLFDVVPEMIDEAIRHMPVIDDRGTVVGIVSMRDLMNPLLLDALSGRSRVVRIESYERGRLMIDGTEERRDLILTSDGERRHWRHAPGHQVSLVDFHAALENDPALLIVGTGADGRLGFEPGLTETLRRRGVQVEVMRTDAAVARVNELLDHSDVPWTATLDLT